MLSRCWRLIRGNPNFRRLWVAQIISEIGDWFYALAVYNLLLDLTGGKAVAVGAAVVLQVLPQTFVGPTAGVINDRVSRKRVMIAADVARFFIVLCMLMVRTRTTAWLAFPLLLLETVGAAFFEPARNAVVPNIMPKEDVLDANALSSATWSFCLAVGATLGGLAAVALGRDAVFLLNALSFLASAVLIRRMKFAEPHTAGIPPMRWRDLVDFSPMREGIRYIAADRRLLATVWLKGGLGLMGANNVLLPLLGERVLPVHFPDLPPQRGAMLGMSLLMGARGVGSLLGPYFGSMLAHNRESRLRAGVLAGFLMAAVFYLALSGAGSLWTAVLWVTLAHAGGSTIWVFSTTLLQFYTDDRFRGRVFAADLGLLTLAISLSAWLAGVAVDRGIDVRTACAATGVLMFLPAAAWAVTMRTVRK
jgi:predicted MFS family arabinose efflux permease